MSTMRRARQPEQKEKRRQAILDAALRLWLREKEDGEFTMSRLAEQTGLAKGTLYLYFGTKEELFLALLEGMLGSWFDELIHKLRPLAGKGTATRVARVLSRTLADREPLTRLFPLLASVLEPGMNAQTAIDFKQSVCARATEAEATLEQAVPGLPAGEGHRVLVHALALTTGLRQMYENEKTLQQIMPLEPGMRCFPSTVAHELEIALTALIRGFLAGIIR
jgi:AcrR family transcriptional regulator